jgi:hypothetical protein
MPKRGGEVRFRYEVVWLSGVSRSLIWLWGSRKRRSEAVMVGRGEERSRSWGESSSSGGVGLEKELRLKGRRGMGRRISGPELKGPSLGLWFIVRW